MPPALVYEGARGKAGRPLQGAPGGGVLLLVGVGLPFPSPTRKEEGGRKERERERERGLRPPSPSPTRTPLGGGAPPPGCCPLSPLKAHQGPILPRGVPVTLRHSGLIRNFSGTLPVSEYSRPIYQSLCLDHFETPRHVRDHIRDSEQPSVHQNI